MKVVTVVGARPQFIKVSPVSKALALRNHEEILIHTGQHFDHTMSQVFFTELGLPQPAINLGIAAGSHANQVGKMMMALETEIRSLSPDVVMVYGDTNSTLAGALAASFLGVPIAHVEAGLRSHNWQMPEERNRILTDRCSNLLFCPVASAKEALEQEGITQGVHVTGDVMYDASVQFLKVAEKKSLILQRCQLDTGAYVLATLHRPVNVDNPHHLEEILKALSRVKDQVVVPLHPRTRKNIANFKLEKYLKHKHVKIIDPVGYLDMLMLEKNARLIVTDSGGVQKEAYFMETPCLTVRKETEWKETLSEGWNKLVEPQNDILLQAIEGFEKPIQKPFNYFGDGQAAVEIVRQMEAYFKLKERII